MSLPSYTQPAKNHVRELLLKRAVDALTVERAQAAIVRRDEFDEMIAYATHELCKFEYGNPRAWTEQLPIHAAEWRDFHSSRVGARTPRDLRVLYLCGPEPVNDLDVLLKLGILPQNIWAVEAEAEEYRSAINSLSAHSAFVRVHHGKVETFFDLVNERFDIVYIDACGPLPGGSVNTLRSPLNMFHRERLAEISVLITNFASPPPEKREEYTELLAVYFGPRYNDCPKALWDAGADPVCAHLTPDYLIPYIRNNFEAVYSDFVTRFMIDIGRDVVPQSRIVANHETRRKYFASDTVVERCVASALSYGAIPEGVSADEALRLMLSGAGQALLTPQAFPVWTMLQNAGDRKLTVRPLLQALLTFPLAPKTVVEDLLPRAALLGNIEGWGGPPIASEQMLAAIKHSWFGRGPFCDIPMPNLLINSLIGIYGHPYLVNPRLSTRVSYVAKQTPMYADCTVLDQCRYYFDYLPTIDLIPARFKDHAYQMILRVCLDRMGRHDHSCDSHPFHAAALAGFGECPGADAYNIAERAAVIVA